jgi:CheY-like chemotaxis protein
VSDTGRPATILAVEDEPLNRMLLHAVLEREGYSLIDAGTLAEARERISERLPDIVLLDLRLPDGNGLELCRELKNEDSTAGVPVVVTTASVMPAIVTAAKDAGCAGFLAKPIRPSELLAEVGRLLGA